MNSNLKILGLVLLASLALGGIVAAAAQAETPIKSEGAGVTTLDITNDQNEHGKLARLSFGNKARFVECTSVKVSGLAFTGSVTTITGTPEFAECFANNQTSSPVEVPPIKCKIKFTVRKASTGDATGEGCTNIEVNVYENAEAQKNKKALCAYHIEMPQTVSGALVKNAGGSGSAMDITAELAKSSKLAKITNTGAGGLAVCGLAINVVGEADFSGNLTVTGTNEKGAQVGVTLE